MEPISLTDGAEFLLPPEFLTDKDFLVEKENNGGGINEPNKCFLPYDSRHGFGYSGVTSGFGSTVQPTFEDDFSSGFYGNHPFPAGNDNKFLGTSQSALCRAGNRCGCRNQRSNKNCQSRVSSQAACDLYCAAMEKMARMNITGETYGYNNHNSRGLLELPRKYSFAAAKIRNNCSGFYNHQSVTYQKLQAIQFHQLKQQQLMKNQRQLVHQSRGVRVNNNKNGGPVDLSSPAWTKQIPRRDNSAMRPVFTGKRSSTGTGVFFPQRVNLNSTASAETRKNLTDVPWRQGSNNGGFSSQMHGGVKAEQAVNEPQLPSDWAY